MEHVLACYKVLRAKQPDLVDASIVSSVATELKRAKRTDEAERFSREPG